MKSMTKRMGAVIAVSALAVTTAVAGTGMLIRSNVNAVAEENAGFTYFYDRLGDDKNAKNFYKAFETLDKNGEFKKGFIEYNLVDNNVVTAGDVESYVENGNMRVPKAYGAGRDSYIMDHPDLFYIDPYGTSINAGQMGGKYVAFLDSSRVSTLYNGSFDTPEKIESAIAQYESKLGSIVAAAKASGGVKEQIEYVNQYICDNTVYSFGNEVKDGKNVETPAAAYISTAYGSLVNGKAICGGYSMGFKAVMDRLGIPCVCVQGYSIHDDGTSEAHMWNVVQLEGMWYNVDVTWNDTTGDNDKWLLLGSKNFDYAHSEDRVISSSGFELEYPAAKPYDYGNDTDENGMDISGSYTETDSGKLLNITVSFENKGGLKLHEEGKYLAFRWGDTDKETGGIKWGAWLGAVEANEIGGVWKFTETGSETMLNALTGFIQVALMNRAPDESYGAFYPDEDRFGENAGKEWFYGYKPENLKESDFIVKPSEPYKNDGHGTYFPAPWGNPNPSNGGSYPVDGTYEIKITYTESLELIDTTKEAGLNLTTSRGNDTIMDNVKIENFEWDGDKVIKFKLTPSKMYIHNLADYIFVPDNLQGVNSKKIPSSVIYSFKGKSVVCSKIFNDGRLYMNVYGEPRMLDNSDLSVTDFKDENGNYYAENQRSQLLLVAEKPDKNKENEMHDVLLDDTKIEQEDIVTSATYEIHLQICGVVTKVPNGSYMQVAFGFPEGFSPDDAGTTFKIYHYTHDDSGKITGIEEIPVIVTQYGLIAQVKSFSPFTVVQIKNSSAAVTESAKSVYSSASGNGTIKTEDGKGGINALAGDTITYKITADEGYRVSHVLLNGMAVNASRYADGKLTLGKDELASSNTLEAVFMSEKSAKSYEDKGVTIKVIESPTIGNPIAPNPENPASSSNTLWVVLGCVFGAIALGAGVAIVLVILKKKKGETN